MPRLTGHGRGGTEILCYLIYLLSMNDTKSSIGRRLIILGIVFLIFLAFLHLFAVASDAYFIIWWFDIFMHGFGGVTIGLLIIGFFLHINIKKESGTSLKKIFVSLVIYMFIAMIIWEIFEYISFILHSQIWNGWSDTIQDIIMGYMGSFVVFLSTRKYIQSSLA